MNFGVVKSGNSGKPLSKTAKETSFIDWTPTKKHVIEVIMDKVINLGIPHVGELIFESVNTPRLIKCLLVSETWKILAEIVLIKRIKRLKRKTFEALLCQASDNGRKDVVKLLIDNYPNLNARDDAGRTGRKDVVQSIIYHSGSKTKFFCRFCKRPGLHTSWHIVTECPLWKIIKK